jgi:CheY-like chemotaxis protein
MAQYIERNERGRDDHNDDTDRHDGAVEFVATLASHLVTDDDATTLQAGGAFEPWWWIPTVCGHVFQDPITGKRRKLQKMSPVGGEARRLLSSSANTTMTGHFTANLANKEGIMGEFTSGFFMGDQATNGRVLVVDDEADVRKVVRMTLQKAGYDVLEAENGEKAIETINAGENRLLLDVLVCDIRMPKINGVEAIAYFRANYPRVPVIVLTGFPDADMATSMLRQGVVDYLVKPVEGEKLRESVARAMDQRELAHL